jgi:NADH-quinone oxidoreductase subunit I
MFKAVLDALKNLFTAPSTHDYPSAPSSKDKQIRGLILFEEPKCIWCLKCEDVCPPGAIRFTQDTESYQYTYHYNPYLCIYCGECVRACPDKAEALSQCSELSPPLTDPFMNDAWFAIEKEAEESKERVKALKKSGKTEEPA